MNKFWKFKYDLRVNYPALHLWFVGLFWIVIFIIIALFFSIIGGSCYKEVKREFKTNKPIAQEVGEFFGNMEKDFKKGYQKTSGDSIK